MQIRRIIQLCGLGVSAIAMASSPVTYLSPSQVEAGGLLLSNPGLYIMTDDASSAAANIIISGANVVLDMNGKTISSNQNPVIDIEAQNVTVKNGTINQFSFTDAPQTGIGIASFVYAVINCVQVIGMPLYGIGVDAGATAFISGCKLLGNVGAGIGFAANTGTPTASWVTNCEISNGGDGIDVASGWIAYIDRCFASNNIGVGFNYETGASGVIKNSTAEFNGSWGFETATTTVQVRGNIGFGNAGTGGSSTADVNYNLDFTTYGYVQVVNGTQARVTNPASLAIDDIIDNISIVPVATILPV